MLYSKQQLEQKKADLRRTNAEIRDILVQNGSDPTRSRNVFHCFYFVSETDAKRCATILEQRGGSVNTSGERDSRETGGFAWYLEIIIPSSVDQAAIDPITDYLCELASPLYGDYDGWYAEV